jgi:hypothetical protein
MGKLESELISLGFQQTRASNWTRKHDIVQIVRSSERPKVRVMWREYWKDFFAIIFDYSKADGPICIVPTIELFNSPFVSQKRKDQAYVNSGYYWSQKFNFEDDLAQLVLSFENRWDVLGEKAGATENNEQKNANNLGNTNNASKVKQPLSTQALLTCTMTDFHVFLDAKIKNGIPNLTRNERIKLKGKCQNPQCGKKAELHSAHVHGLERTLIIDSVIKNYFVDEKEQIIQVDLHKVIAEIFEAHKPINEHFRFLCSECHRKYDKGTLAIN